MSDWLSRMTGQKACQTRMSVLVVENAMLRAQTQSLQLKSRPIHGLTWLLYLRSETGSLSIRISIQAKNYTLQEGDKSGIQHLSISIIYSPSFPGGFFTFIHRPFEWRIMAQLLLKCFSLTSEPLVLFPNPTALMLYFSGPLYQTSGNLSYLCFEWLFLRDDVAVTRLNEGCGGFVY